MTFSDNYFATDKRFDFVQVVSLDKLIAYRGRAHTLNEYMALKVLKPDSRYVVREIDAKVESIHPVTDEVIVRVKGSVSEEPL